MQSQFLDAAACQREVIPSLHAFLALRSIHMSLPCMSVTQQKSLINFISHITSITARHEWGGSISRPPLLRSLKTGLSSCLMRANKTMNNWKPLVRGLTAHLCLTPNVGSPPCDVDTVPQSFCFLLSRTCSRWKERAGKPGWRPTGVLCSVERRSCYSALVTACVWVGSEYLKRNSMADVSDV